MLRKSAPLPPQTILVIGATSMIVQAALRNWAMPGAHLILIARNAQKLHAVAQDCRVRGAEVETFTLADAADIAAIEPTLNKAWPKGVLLSGALIAHGDLPNQEQAQDDLEAIAQQTMVNGTSAACWLAALAPRFIAQNTGWVAAITSVAAVRGRAKMYVYGGAKALLSHHLEGLRQRCNGTQVRVVELLPGPIFTPMTAELGRMPLLTTPEAIAPRLVQACGHGTRGTNGKVYLPFAWGPIMTLLAHIPTRIWKGMKI